jgi:hypothetical protein
MHLTDIRSVTNPRFWLPIAAAACVVDTAGLFIWRYETKPTSPINKWYDQFGLSAYAADVLSIMIGVILTQLVATWLGGPWNPLTFCGVAVAIQMIHDLFFANVVVPAVPKGRNSIIDLMMEYTHIEFPQGILIVDAIYMILASLITMALSSVNSSISWITLLITLYTTMYILYTKSPLPP